MMHSDLLATELGARTSAIDGLDWRELVFPDQEYSEVILPCLALHVVLAPPPNYAAGYIPHTDLTIHYDTAQGERVEEIDMAPEEELLAARSLPEGMVSMPREGLVRLLTWVDSMRRWISRHLSRAATCTTCCTRPVTCEATAGSSSTVVASSSGVPSTRGVSLAGTSRMAGS